MYNESCLSLTSTPLLSNGRERGWQGVGALAAVVQLKFERVYLQAHFFDFLPFEFDVAFEQVVAENVALFEEGVVGFQRVQRLLQREGDLRDVVGFFRRQVVEVFVHRLARMQFVFDAVQARHQQRGKGEVGVGGGVGEADFDAPRFGVGDVGDADGGAAVARGVGEHDRRFKVRHEAFVAVGGGVGKGVQGARVFDDAADEVQRHVGEAAVAVATKEVFAVFDERDVDVHAGAVVADDGLGHEGRGFARRVGDVVDDVFELLDFVGLAHQGVVAHADFALAGSDFVVLHFHALADAGQQFAHFCPQVVQGIHRGDREVAAFDVRAVAAVAGFDVGGTVPDAFFGDDFKHDFVHAGLVFHFVENEKFVLRAEVGGIGNAGGLEVGLGTAGKRARVARVALHGVRLDDVAGEDEGFVRVEGIDVGSGRVGHEDHVGVVDAFPAGEGGAVEHFAFFEEVFVDVRRVADVVFFASAVGDAQVKVFDVFVVDELQDVVRGHAVAPVVW